MRRKKEKRNQDFTIYPKMGTDIRLKKMIKLHWRRRTTVKGEKLVSSDPGRWRFIKTQMLGPGDAELQP